MGLTEHSYASNYCIATPRVTGKAVSRYISTHHPLRGVPCRTMEHIPLTYFMIPDKASNPEIGEYKTYSIAAYYYLGALPVQVVRDVSSDGDRVFSVVRALNKHKLSLLHLMDAIEDMLG